MSYSVTAGSVTLSVYALLNYFIDQLHSHLHLSLRQAQIPKLPTNHLVRQC